MNNLFHFVLLADIKDVIGGLVAILVPLLWVIKQIAEATKQGKAPEAAPAAVPRQPEPLPPPRAAAGQQADPLRNQVEEFLRRAGQGRQADRPRPVPSEVEVLIDEGPAPARPAPVAMPAPASALLKGAAPLRRSVVPRKRKTLAERADERAAARTSRIAEQTSHLGERIISEDQQFDVKLKAKFDHAVGTLTGSDVAAAEQAAVALRATETPAAQIAAMLATPEGVRQAIVVNEILSRPTDRW